MTEVKGRLFRLPKVTESETLLMTLKPKSQRRLTRPKAGEGLKKRVEANNEGRRKSGIDVQARTRQIEKPNG